MPLLLREWETFFYIVGSAAAALTALQFLSPRSIPKCSSGSAIGTTRSGGIRVRLRAAAH